MKYSELNNRIKTVVEKAENLAITGISNDIDISPFLVYGGNSDKIKRLIVDSIDEAIDLTEEELEELEEETNTVVLTFKDKISLKDGTFDSIIYQIYDTDEDDGYSFGQIYKIENGKIVFLNEKVFLGKIRNLLIF